MGMQDVSAPQHINRENKREVESRLREIDETFVKFEEEQQTSGFMHPGLLTNGSVCGQEDPYAIQQMIAPILYIKKNLMRNSIAHI